MVEIDNDFKEQDIFYWWWKLLLTNVLQNSVKGFSKVLLREEFEQK